jgi:uncharacterized protein (DUF1778 family)
VKDFQIYAEDRARVMMCDRQNRPSTRETKSILAMCASETHIAVVSTIAGERKNQRLVARVSKSHKKLFERAAAIEGRSVATFVITHALEAAEQLVREQDTIRLSAEQSRRFVEALLAPPRPVPGALRRAQRQYQTRLVNRL